MKPRKWIFQWALAGLVLMGGLLLAEFYLRHTQRFADYQEKNGEKSLGHTLERLPEPWLWIFGKKNAHWVRHKTEFDQEVTTNAWGLVGKLPSEKKPSGEIRILAIGDSCTMGAGDLLNQGYPGLLEQKLNTTNSGRIYKVINAGVWGSDPVFGLQLLQRRLWALNPDIVLITINSTDAGELVRRGGFDRFNEKGQLKPLHNSIWISLYDKSHLIRAFFVGWLHYNWLLQSPREQVRTKKQAVQELVEACKQFQELGKKHGVKALVLLHPDWREIRKGQYVQEVQEVLGGLQVEHVDAADLMGYFIAHIPRPITTDYYWPLDGHFTHKGYVIFAGAVEEALRIRKWI